MNRSVGLWIDHQCAVIVSFASRKAKIHRVESQVGRRTRYSGASHARGTAGLHDDWAEDKRDRRVSRLLANYYDEVIAHLRDADSILIMGPGEAKLELQNRLQGAIASVTVEVEAVDKMTERQIVAKIRKHFRR
jgi:hypothetical protein